MTKLITYILNNFGYQDINEFAVSTFHPSSVKFIITFSSISGTLGYYFEEFVGIEPIIGLVMIGLFLLEIGTGISASIKEGHKFESRKLGRAGIKMLVYIIMIGFTHVLSINITIKPIIGILFNYYEWIHYTFFNLVLLNLILSNLENFVRLGWDEFFPVIKKITNWTKLKKDE